MTSGNLYDYLMQHRPIKPIQLTWFREMAHTLIHIHDVCVVVADIATRNFLLAADLSVKFSDFTESSILPLGTNVQNADDAGYSIYTDIGQLGAVMYEVITGKPCEFDLFKNQPAAWPRPLGHGGRIFLAHRTSGLVPLLRHVELKAHLRMHASFSEHWTRSLWNKRR